MIASVLDDKRLVVGPDNKPIEYTIDGTQYYLYVDMKYNYYLLNINDLNATIDVTKLKRVSEYELIDKQLLSYSGDSYINITGDIISNFIDCLIACYVNNIFVNMILIISLIYTANMLIPHAFTMTLVAVVASIKKVLGLT
jgi:hypothetical protein